MATGRVGSNDGSGTTVTPGAVAVTIVQGNGAVDDGRDDEQVGDSVIQDGVHSPVSVVRPSRRCLRTVAAPASATS